MPTQRFLNLKESKKNAILEAAANEFARVPYSAASINQIIKEAEISRGSFYTYFEDKDDLMRYMLRGFRDTLRKKIFEILPKQDITIFELKKDESTLEDAFIKLIDSDKKENTNKEESKEKIKEKKIKEKEEKKAKKQSKGGKE